MDFCASFSTWFGLFFLGLPSLQKCVCDILGEIWFGVRFEILKSPMGKIWWNLGGGLVYLPRHAWEIAGRISGQVSEQISETSFQISQLFFRKLRSAEGRCYFVVFSKKLDVPRVRFSISGIKSGANPETPRKLSQSEFWISRFRTVGDPETLENKADSLPRLISEMCYPEYGWDPFLFWKGPLHGTVRAGYEFPNSTGGTSEKTLCPEPTWFCNGKSCCGIFWPDFFKPFQVVPLQPKSWRKQLENIRGLEKGLAGGGWRPTAPKIQQNCPPELFSCT